MPPSLLHTWFELLSPEQIVTAYGMTENLGLPRCAATSCWLIRAASVAASETPRSGFWTPIRKPVPAGEDGDIYLRAPDERGDTSIWAGHRHCRRPIDGFAPPATSDTSTRTVSCTSLTAVST